MNKLKLRLLTVGLLSASLLGCGSKKSANNASQVPRGTLPSLDGRLLAECTNVAPNNMYLTAQLASYYYNGSSNNEYIQMNITALPAEFYTEGYSIQIHRYREPTAGARLYNEIPVPMYFVNKLSGLFPTVGSSSTSLSRSVFEEIIEENSLADLDINATNFLDNYYILMTGMEYQWEAVQIRLMSGASLITSAESLLPPFFADPNVYVSGVPVPALHGLHPLITSASSGASEAEFKRLADQICASFFSTVRNTASIDEVEPQSFVAWLQWAWNKITAWLS